MLTSASCAVAPAKPFEIETIAPGVYVHYGAQEDSGPANGGDIANIGFIVGEKCVAVIDTGGTQSVGQALRSAIQRTTAKPICYVINTHVHPDHIMGNAAFVADKPEFIGAAKLAAAIQARAGNYLSALKRDLGEQAQGTSIVAPTRFAQEPLKLDLGGRTLTLRPWQTAHTDNDLTVFDEQTRTLWTGDLMFVDRIPVLDGNLKGWLKTLDEIRGTQAAHVVPGHRKAHKDWTSQLDTQRGYLAGLKTGVQDALKRRMTMQQAVEAVGTELRSKWLLFDSFHRRNVSAAYAELEWDD